jgi:hypothetical protein
MNENKLLEEILGLIKNDQSVAIVGATNSGKTWFAQNKIIPFLQDKDFKVCYLKESLVDYSIPKDVNIVIADEFETFADKEFLEKRYLECDPYYTDSYIEQVENCHKAFESVNISVIFLITRNNDEEIKYLANNLRKIDSGQSVKSFIYKDKFTI